MSQDTRLVPWFAFANQNDILTNDKQEATPSYNGSGDSSSLHHIAEKVK